MLDVRALESKCHKRIYRQLEEDSKQVLNLDFGDTSDKLKDKHMNVYEGVKSKILYTTKFDKNLDLDTPHLGNEIMSKSDKLKVEESIPTPKQGYATRKS